MLLPQLEQASAYNQLQFGQHTSFMFQAGSGYTVDNWPVLTQLRVPVLSCPSSSLPSVSAHSLPAGSTPSSVPLQNNDYVGISGHTRDAVSNADLYTAGSYGYAASNGSLYTGSRTSMRDLIDGSSNTLVVGEQSGPVTDAAGKKGTAGMTHDLRQGSYSGGAWVGANSWACNVTSIRFPINSTALTNDAAGGFFQKYTYNNPLTSSHAGGTHGLLGDGSVRFLSENMNEATLQRLAIRNDGQVVGEF
jgi:hypothetical protein